MSLTVTGIPCFNFLYAFTDDFSIFLTLPVSPGNKIDTYHSSGIEDCTVQLEYAYYNREEKYTLDQFTIVGNISLPTGSENKTPYTGFGAPSFFSGLTFNHMEVNWFYFFSPGFLLTMGSKHIHVGNQFYYQLGIGRNICDGKDWIFNWLIEFDGIYYWRNRVNHQLDPNSGGNVIFVTPSLSFANKTSVFQLGIGFPLVQDLFGNQLKQDIALDFYYTYTF